MADNQINMDDMEDDIQTNFQKSFGWFLVVNKISDNDFTKHEYIYKKNIVEVLNQLTYLISYDQEQIRLQREANNQI